ncbi:MAG: hypothetical protein WAT23_13010, partial [Chromatiaceae bacterium]
MAERHNLEKFLGMSGGYVLNFSDRTFGEFVFEAAGIDIHDEKYTAEGTSKAKKLRTFWKLEEEGRSLPRPLPAMESEAKAGSPRKASARACRR